MGNPIANTFIIEHPGIIEQPGLSYPGSWPSGRSRAVPVRLRRGSGRTARIFLSNGSTQ